MFSYHHGIRQPCGYGERPSPYGVAWILEISDSHDQRTARDITVIDPGPLHNYGNAACSQGTTEEQKHHVSHENEASRPVDSFAAPQLLKSEDEQHQENAVQDHSQ
jgi:hypothetical protein